MNIFFNISGMKLLQTHKSNSVLNTFKQLFSHSKSRLMMKIKKSNDTFAIKGYIGKEGHVNKSLQFVYINGRIVLKTKIHKLVSSILAKSSVLRVKGSPRIPGQPPGSPAKSQDKHGKQYNGR